MQAKNQYIHLNQDQYYADKTAALEKGIAVFPSIYVEGAAACGKTTAVRMLLARHREVEGIVFWIEEEAEEPALFQARLRSLGNRSWSGDGLSVGEGSAEAGQTRWVVFENLYRGMPDMMAAEIVRYIQKMPPEEKVILISRDKPAEAFLELLWKRQMEIIPQQELLLSRTETIQMADALGSRLDPRKVYERTGGWAGCADLLFRLAAGMGQRNADQNKGWNVVQNTGKAGEPDVEELCEGYEIRTYIDKYILDSISGKEQELMQRAALCPWMDEALCAEVWGTSHTAEDLKALTRKGMLLYDKTRKRWKIAPLFAKRVKPGRQETQDGGEKVKLGELSEWYEKHGYIKEALEYVSPEDVDRYHQCMLRYYDKVPFLGITYHAVTRWKENVPEIIYLRGMYAYFHGDLQEFRRELGELEKLEESIGIPKGAERTVSEIYLNMKYVDPEMSLDDWLALLEKLTQEKSEGSPFRLYGILGGSTSYLCGFRDLSGLFACTRKEENYKARIWRRDLGEAEWIAYQFARMDYYLETERLDKLKEEDREFMNHLVEEKEDRTRGYETCSWRVRLALLYLWHKRQAMRHETEMPEGLWYLEQSLYQEDHPLCVSNTEAVSSIFAVWQGSPEQLTGWIRRAESGWREELTEENYYSLCCQAKGYLLLGQYEKAGKLLRRVTPYLRNYRRNRYLAEALFQQAIVNWETGSHSQALQNVIESFLIGGESRYVSIYVSYGKRGKEVLDAYIEWQRDNFPESWHKKKKYNYGNVLRMPMVDYVDVILRGIRHRSSGEIIREEISEERLTMMETIILQSIGRGLTNAEICEELNLKLPTVKSHIYSMYKKLGVNSRVQAILKGKEKGILS